MRSIRVMSTRTSAASLHGPGWLAMWFVGPPMDRRTDQTLVGFMSWKPAMNTDKSAMRSSQGGSLGRLIAGLCTRTLNQFAEESRLDVETLREAVERYEGDFAWQG